jgi:hypothetical protein
MKIRVTKETDGWVDVAFYDTVPLGHLFSAPLTREEARKLAEDLLSAIGATWHLPMQQRDP